MNRKITPALIFSLLVIGSLVTIATYDQNRSSQVAQVAGTGTTWYARSHWDGPYGTGDGSSYANAFQGVFNVKWGAGGVSAGDTLYICGIHTRLYLNIQADGAPGAPITIDGNCPGEPSRGLIMGVHNAVRNGGWTDPDGDGVFEIVLSGSIVPGMPAFEDPGKSNNPDNFVRLTNKGAFPNGTWEPGSFYVSTSTKIAYYKPKNGDPNANYFYNSAGANIINANRPYLTFKNLRIMGSYYGLNLRNNQYPIVDNIEIKWAEGVGIAIDGGSDHGKILNSHIYETSDGIYATNSGANPDINSDPIEDWIISGNRIHHMRFPESSTIVYNDNHCIGWQNGRNIVVEKNDLSYCGGAMLLFWLGGSGYQDNIVIRNNFLHDHPRRSSTEASWTKTGIGFSHTNATYNPDKINRHLIYNNIVTRVGHTYAIGEKSAQNMLGVLPSGIFNNTVSAPYVYAPPGGTLYGTAFQLSDITAGTLASTLKNNVGVYVESGQLTFDHAHVVDPDYSQVDIDYNNWWSPSGARLKWKGTTYTGLSAWQAGTQSAGTPHDEHSIGFDPKFVNTSGSFAQPSDFTPAWDSPLIDAGVDVSALTGNSTDYFGNSYYGVPDIGAIEYQPPYTMGGDTVNSESDVRVYGNGKFRNTKSPTGTSVGLSIIPQSGNTREWLDVDVLEWGTIKRWKEVSQNVSGAVSHTVSSLSPSASYLVTYAKDGGSETTLGTFSSNGSGALTFAYDKGYSSVTFSVTPSAAPPPPPPPPSGDTSAPTIPENLRTTSVSSSAIGLAWNPSSDNVGVVGYNIYNNGTFIAQASSTSFIHQNLTPSTSFSYTVRAFDAAQNLSGTSLTLSITTLTPSVQTQFKLGDRVELTQKARIRSGPGLSAPQLVYKKAGHRGSLIQGPTLADGFVWWKIDFEKGTDGWVEEVYFKKI